MEEGQSNLKWDNHKSTFFENLKTLRETSDYTDSTLAVEGKFYPVHKLVMSTYSEYFRDIFEMTPCKSPVIVLKDVRNHDIKALLDYIYLGEVNINRKDLASVLKTAECLRIKGLAFPNEDSTKIHQNSNSSHGDALRDSPPFKRRRPDSNTMLPYAVSAVSSPPDNHPVIKVEMDFADGQEQTIRREIDYKKGSSSGHDPDEEYRLEITKTEHEIEIDYAEEQEIFSRINTFEEDASGDCDPLGECSSVSDLSKMGHELEKDVNNSLPNLSSQNKKIEILHSNDGKARDKCNRRRDYCTDLSKTGSKPENDDNTFFPEPSLINISQGGGALHQKSLMVLQQQQQHLPQHPQLQKQQHQLPPRLPEQPLPQQQSLLPKQQEHQGGQQPIADVIKKTCAKYGHRFYKSANGPVPYERFNPDRRESISECDRLVQGEHFPVEIGVNAGNRKIYRQCHFCAKQTVKSTKTKDIKTSNIKCKVCKCVLCVTPCFHLYHTLKDYTIYEEKKQRVLETSISSSQSLNVDESNDSHESDATGTQESDASASDE